MAAGYTTSAAKGGLFTQGGGSTALSDINYLRDAYASSVGLISAAEATGAATAAAALQTGQDAIATAADRVQTGLDVTATAAYEAATQILRDDVLSTFIGNYANDAAADASGFTIGQGIFYWNTTDLSLRIHDGTTWGAAVLSAGGALVAVNNLSELVNVATARTNLGLGTAATTASTDYATAAQGTAADAALPKTGGAMVGAITTNSTFDGRDVAADGTKLDGVEALADVTDTANVMAAGALMDSELTSIVSVKALNQGLATTDSPTFADVTTTGTVTANSYTEAVFAVTGTTPALDPANGSIQTWSLSAASTPTDSFAAGESITLMIDDGTAYTITWPTMTWVNNEAVAPTLATTGYTVVALWKVSTTLYGALVGDGS